MRKKALAIIISDLHLSHHPPALRSEEPDWYEAMARPLEEIKDVRKKLKVPVLCAGDIFHRWGKEGDKQVTPQLLNFAIDHLPHKMYAIPGQHDMPNHNINQMNRSAYETLIRSHRIIDLVGCNFDQSIDIFAFPYGAQIHPPGGRRSKLTICVAHRYYWTRDACFQTADPQRMIQKTTPEEFRDYDVVILGDNHQGFTQITTHRGKQTTIFNCGSMMVRRTDEQELSGCYGILYADGTVMRYRFNRSKDVYRTSSDIQEELAEHLDMDSLSEELTKLTDNDLDFATAVRRFLRANPTKPEVADLIKKAMNNG